MGEEASRMCMMCVMCVMCMMCVMRAMCVMCMVGVGAYLSHPPPFMGACGTHPSLTRSWGGGQQEGRGSVQQP